MIKKLEEHRDMKNLVIEIGKLHDIEVTPTTNNDSKGDFSYPKEKQQALIDALDKYIGKYKHRKQPPK